MEFEYDGVELTPAHMSGLKPTRVFKENQLPIASICFDDPGELCVISAEDESLNVYDCRNGKCVSFITSCAIIRGKRDTDSCSVSRHISTLYSKKYGVHLARFTHQSSTVIYASTKEDGKRRDCAIEHLRESG